MPKVTLTDIVSGFASTSALNDNFDIIETAFDNTLSRDGSSPNQMSAQIDMNSNRIINLADAENAQDAITKAQLEAYAATDLTTADASVVDYTPSGANAVERTVQSKLRDTVSPLDFGAAADGATDDATEINAAISALPAGGVLDGLGKTYRVDSTITLSKRVTLQNMKIDFSNAATGDKLFEAAGTQGTGLALTADASLGDTQLTVADTSSLTAGGYYWLSSNTDWISGTHIGEIVRIKTIDSATQFTLFSPTLDLYASSSGEIAPLNFIEDITLDNIIATGSGTGGEQYGLEFDKCNDVTIKNCRFDKFADRCGKFIRCANVTIDGGRGSEADRSGLGYGYTANDGTHWFTMRGFNGDNMRHLFASGGTDGVNRFLTVDNCHGYGMKDSMLDAHVSADYVTFTNCTGTHITDNGSDDGITFQGAHCNIANNYIYGSVRHGVFVQMTATNVGNGSMSAVITGNHTFSPGSNGVFVEQQSASVTLNGLVVSNNLVLTPGASGIRIEAETGNIRGVQINGNTVMGITGASNYPLMLYAGASNTLIYATITGNTLVRDDDLAENILLSTSTSGNVSRVAASGNAMANGTYAIGGTNATRATFVGNTVTSMATGTANVGSPNTVANNTTT